MGLRFYISRNSGTGGDGWVHMKGANSMAACGFDCRKARLVGTGWATYSSPPLHEWA